MNPSPYSSLPPTYPFQEPPISNPLNRRQFLRQAAASTAVAGTLSRGAWAGPASPSDKLNLAIIGSGGRGWANMMGVATENIAAVCDVDTNRLARAGDKFPDAKRYTDFRKLLEQEKNLDGVVVSTPDHCHAPASVMAMRRGLHVYCEKPLTHSVHEARVMAQVAAEHKVVTQMGTGAQSSEGHIRAVEMIRSGAIGEVREAHVWTNRPIWPQGQALPPGEDPVPGHLDWDLWLGPASRRPFLSKYPDGPFKGKQVYHPFVWRGWWDFGTGALGDIAPHSMNVVFWALDLGAPESVEAESSPMRDGAFPSWSVIRFHFPECPRHTAMTLVWYDGGKKPSHEVTEGKKFGDNGTLFVGAKGKLLVGQGKPFPEKTFADYEPPKPTLPRRIEIHQDWIRAIKENDQTGCHFGYSGPMTEAYLLGNIALRTGKKITWNPAKMQVTNCPEAQGQVCRDYRPGWTL